jgi:hypothetical protein
MYETGINKAEPPTVKGWHFSADFASYGGPPASLIC